MRHIRRLLDWQRRITAVRRTYRNCHGRRLSLFFPRLYSEKIQWRKLFDEDPRHRIFCDKLATRDYIAEKGFGHLLPELVWSGEDLSNSPIRSLDFPVVLKSNHATAQYVFVHDCAAINYDKIADEARQWLTIDWGDGMNEPAYLGIPRRLMIERTVTNPDGSQTTEHRVFVFHGKAKLIASMMVKDGGVFALFHTPNWQRLPWRGINPPYEADLPKPERLAEMISVAEQLAETDEHLRIDFYDNGTRLYVGEITVYTWSGLLKLSPQSADEAMGAFWLPARPLRKALARLAFGEWGAPFKTMRCQAKRL